MNSNLIFKRKDIYNNKEYFLSPSINELIRVKINLCANSPTENSIVRIGPQTYLNVRPNIHTHKMVGWTLGTPGLPYPQNIPSFFEVSCAINHNRPSLLSSLTEKNMAWNVRCVASKPTSKMSKIKKVLVIKSINNFAIERVMPYWAPIIQKLGSSTRGSDWRMPIMYMTQPSLEYNKEPLGVHIPLTEKSSKHKVIQSLFNNSIKTVDCVFDMSNLKVLNVDGCEYLVALGTIANDDSSLFSISMVIGVYDLENDDKEDVNEDLEI